MAEPSAENDARPKFAAFRNKRLQNPEVRAAYVEAKRRRDAAKARKRWQREPRHRHTYERVGYGGAGWFLYRCSTCGGTEIDA